jgi:hypothetical protein
MFFSVVFAIRIFTFDTNEDCPEDTGVMRIALLSITESD